MKVVKVRSPFLIEVNQSGQVGSKIELSIYNKGNSIPTILSGVTVSTAGQFSCTAATFAVGNTVTISGTLGGTGTITGYTSPKTYYVIATNGTTSFTLSATLGGAAITTTAGTPTGLTYITQISGFYSLSKSVPSTTQTNTIYNVSNYVKEFIENVQPLTNDEPDIVDDFEWVNFRIKRYWYNGTTYTLLDTNDYVGINGFTNYSDGKQNAVTTLLTPLLNTSIINYYKNATFDSSTQEWLGSSSIENFNFIADKLSNSVLSVRFENLTNTSSITYNLQNGVTGIFNYSIPISIVVNLGSPYATGCKITVSLTPVAGTPIVSFITFAYPIEECKYTPVLCSFVNRYGGYKTITFFKQQTNTIAVKGTDYKLTQQATNYNTLIGQSKTFNINGKQTIKLNTGFIDENYSELITDLLLSETVLLNSKPVTVKTQGSDLKTSLKDRLINYEIEFEYAFNLINDVV